MNRIRQQREDLLALANLYAGLAEALAADRYLPDWLGRAGKAWPLWESASHLASQFEWPAMSLAVTQLAQVTQYSPTIRQLIYEKLLAGNGRLAPMMTYESQVINGRFLGPQTFALQALYHEAWTTVGHLLAAALNPPRKQRQAAAKQTGLPRVSDLEMCTLCSFCVQVCPTHALMMQEDNLATRLTLTASLCIYCHKCEQVCAEKAIDLLGKLTPADVLILRESPRAVCPRCGKPTVSEAEINAIVTRLGEHPAWLDSCLDCR